MRNWKETIWRMILPFYKLYLYGKTRTRFGRKAFFTKGTKFEGCNYVGEGSSLIYSSLGYGSYVTQNSYLERATVGRYCSIASRVATISGAHPTSDCVSTYPAFYSSQSVSGVRFGVKEAYSENKYAQEGYYVAIGNDVWIGQGAQLMQGVTIHDGAVIAAGAVVVKDVPPYAVVGGVPAKIIKYRFEKKEIESLLALQWWGKSHEWLRRHGSKFMNIKAFLHVEDNGIDE